MSPFGFPGRGSSLRGRSGALANHANSRVILVLGVLRGGSSTGH